MDNRDVQVIFTFNILAINRVQEHRRIGRRGGGSLVVFFFLLFQFSQARARFRRPVAFRIYPQVVLPGLDRLRVDEHSLQGDRVVE